MLDVMRVLLRGRLALASGPVFHAGEIVAVPDDLAEQLIAEGRAVLVADAAIATTVAPEAPPVDRRMRSGRPHKEPR
ncbi:MAG: hypothetical protein NUW22_12640 [Acidobacteria bacterium]|nr:hypothetical protein [Acidobacteriota bacterium]